MKLSVIHAGMFKLDGGAMFGIVPKRIWNRLNPADENNLCSWAMRCLLIEKGDRKILVDTGMGNKQDAKFQSHFQPHGDQNLILSIEESLITVEDITDVIITHMHFDHVGGAVSISDKGGYEPTFPNATYWTNELHYRWALDPNPRETASFLKENFVPLQKHGVLKFIDVGEKINFIEGIDIKFYNGHTEAMMVPFIRVSKELTLVYAADLLPSAAHVKLPYIMAYDIRPMVTLNERSEFYDEVANEKHVIYFEHDRLVETGQIYKNERGRYAVNNESTLENSIQRINGLI